MIMNDRKNGEPDERTDTEHVETVPTRHRPDEVPAEEDVMSDPALDDRVGSDWVDEGGAAPEGPATATKEEGQADAPEEFGTEEFGEAGLPKITLDPPD